MILDHIVATMTLDTIYACDTIVAFVIPFVALLTSSPLLFREEDLWNFSVLQRVHFSNLVLFSCLNYFGQMCPQTEFASLHCAYCPDICRRIPDYNLVLFYKKIILIVYLLLKIN
jgi:hypothetical protein